MQKGPTRKMIIEGKLACQRMEMQAKIDEWCTANSSNALVKLLGPPPGKRFLDLPSFLQWWLVGRIILWFLLIAAPFILYRNNLYILRDAWFAPFMGMVACAIPACGAPVAGGVIFLPLLEYYGLCPRDAVAFTSATQMMGVGIFAPMNWLLTGHSVFIPSAIRVSILPSTVGLIAAVTYYKNNGFHADHFVILIFTLFCTFLVAYVTNGLATSRMKFDTGSNKLELKWNLCRLSEGVLPWIICCFLGGILTAYIGVGIEKVVFTLLTLNPLVDIRAATVTSITIVGWLSALAFLFHALSPCDPTAPQYIGAVPYHIWLLGLPGILMGSILGPALNAAVGPRNIMLLFLVMLVVEILRNTKHLLQDWRKPPMETCVPQHENMEIGHALVNFVPWLLSKEHLEYMASLAANWQGMNASVI